jgi:hypothetical protein
MLNTKTTLIALFSAVVLTACGGGSGSEAVQTSHNSGTNQEVITYANAGCPSGIPQVWSYRTSRNLKLIYSANEFEIELPADSSGVNFNACILQPIDFRNSNVPSDVLNLLPQGERISVQLKTAGTIDLLTARKITIGVNTPFDPELGKKIFAHTQNANGTWIRTQLQTSALDGGSTTLYKADIVAPGYYSVE